VTIEHFCDICGKIGGVENFGFATDIHNEGNCKYLGEYVNYDICGECMKGIHRNHLYELECLSKEKLVEFNKLFIKIIKFHIVRNTGK